MNQGVLRSSPVQHLNMGGNPGNHHRWWNINTFPPPLSPPPHQPSNNWLSASSPSASSFSNLFQLQPPPPPPSASAAPNISMQFDCQELAEPWSHDLMLGLFIEEEQGGLIIDYSHERRTIETNNSNNNNNSHWDQNQQQQSLLETSQNNNRYRNTSSSSSSSSLVLDHAKLKQEEPRRYLYGHAGGNDFREVNNAANSFSAWSPASIIPASSPSNKSRVTSSSFSMLDFSKSKSEKKRPPLDTSSSEKCNNVNGNGNGGAQKKAKVQHQLSSSSSSQSNFRVKKERLGDKISSLHQLVSPFGKTDTASVLLEAIGYIRFLQNQIEALSSPYMGHGSGNNLRSQQQQQQQQPSARSDCVVFPEDPGQEVVVNEDPRTKDLRSRGLCLVPVSCTLQVESSDNGADYWASAFGSGFR